ncbi:hypothetical protein DIURU_001463 [Diutina rugosa]|uniref:Serine/threonine-protein kinase BUR1 n=1 Tax=Diutina rugosa TaxID=5481 RepID=A0A642UU62_DIURU|nr:uncharacterized protein DIURU_001463 [Diutina rugosa]KAA8905518.1 hypothetical protein DIURU_001463 [Diutina rugosa]
MTQLRQRQVQPITATERMSRLKEYTVYSKLGQGTFGVVQKAKDSKGRMVALKQLLNHSAKEGFPITAMREITILKRLDHVNVLKIIDMIYDEPKVSNPSELVTTRGCFYTVSPYMSSDLVGLLENPKVHLELPHIKCILKQLLCGVDYLHHQHFLHRDIKAANILLDDHGVVKIADFGLARTYHGKPPGVGTGPGGGERAYTGLVMTRWYRAPELLLGEVKYTTAVDMWGVGCVFGELFTHKPILVGKSDAHQVQLVFQLCGPPTDWSGAVKLPNTAGYNVGLTCKRTLEARFDKLMPPDGVELLSQMLKLDPHKRITAREALSHKFFTTEPAVIEPHQLPKFEECHEIDKERFKKMARAPTVTSYKPLKPQPTTWGVAAAIARDTPTPEPTPLKSMPPSEPREMRGSSWGADGPSRKATPEIRKRTPEVSEGNSRDYQAKPSAPSTEASGIFMSRKRRVPPPAPAAKRAKPPSEASSKDNKSPTTKDGDDSEDIDLDDEDAMAKILDS